MMTTDHHHHTMTITVECEGALADAVLQAARAAVASYPWPAYTVNPWKGCGVKNPPLLTLLDQLIGAAEPVAAAIADNCWDDSLPIPGAMARGMAEALHHLADTITAAAAAPNRADWSLPSMSGKELV